MQACAVGASVRFSAPGYNDESLPGHRIRMIDGLGRRVLGTDAATGEAVEQLELSLELVLHNAFATALADRVTRLAAVRHASYVRVRRVDRPSIDRLVVVSDATAGHRLSDLLAASAAAGIRPDIEAVVALLRQVLPAAALFARHNRENAIGTLAPERLFIVPPARAVIADAWFGPAIDQLQLSRLDAWQRYRIAAPPDNGPVVCTPRGDATALGIIALSMLHGRLLTADEYPDQLPALLLESRERHGDEDHPLSSVFARWMRRALQLDEGGFDSPQAAQVAFEEVLSSNRRYVTGTAALEGWVRACAPAPKEAQPASVGPAPSPAAEVAPTPEGPSAVEADVEVPPSRSPDAVRIFGLRSSWAAVILAVVLLQAGVIGWYWTRPAAGPAEGEGELVITSRPVGAHVIVDGLDRGATPLTLTLPAGAHVVEVQAGDGEPRVIPMVIRANVQTVQYVELQEPEALPPAGQGPPGSMPR